MKGKKWWNVILAFFLLLICRYGADYFINEQESIVWASPFYISPKIECLINQAISDLGYSACIEFKVFSPDDYYDEVAREIEEGNIDVAFCGLTSWEQVGNRLVLNDELIAIDEYLLSDIGQDLYNAYPNEIWESIMIDNHIKWIVSGGNFPVRRAAITDDLDKYHIEVDTINYENICNLALSILSTDDFEGYVIQNPVLLLTRIPNTTFVCSPFIPLIINDNDSDLTLINMVEDERFISTYKAIREIDAMGGVNWELSETDTVFRLFYYTTEADFISSTSNVDINSVIILEETSFNPIETIGSSVGITKCANNPELVFEIIAQIYTQRYLSDIFAYGEEQADFVISNGQAISAKTRDYINPTYTYGNYFITTPTLYQGNNKTTEYLEELESMETSPVAGFVFDGSNVMQELKDVTDIMVRFYSSISQKQIQDDSILEKLRTDLFDAGLQNIIIEANTQLVKWCQMQES